MRASGVQAPWDRAINRSLMEAAAFVEICWPTIDRTSIAKRSLRGRSWHGPTRSMRPPMSASTPRKWAIAAFQGSDREARVTGMSPGRERRVGRYSVVDELYHPRALIVHGPSWQIGRQPPAAHVGVAVNPPGSRTWIVMLPLLADLHRRPTMEDR